MQSANELLTYFEYAAASDFSGGPVISTSSLPLGSILLRMAYGVEPVVFPLPLQNDTTTSTQSSTGYSFPVAGSGGIHTTGAIRGHVDGAYFMRGTRSARTTWTLQTLATSPLVYDHTSAQKIVNALEAFPEYHDYLRRISDLALEGKIDMERDAVRGITAMSNRGIKAVFVPDDVGYVLLYNLIKRYTDDFQDRFEIVPITSLPAASLVASYCAWVPRSSEKVDVVGRLFDALAERDTYESIRYGSATEDWRSVGISGIIPIDFGQWPRLYRGSILDMLSRSGIPERVPSIVAEDVRSSFRIDDRETTSYTVRSVRAFNAHAVRGAVEVWSDLSATYGELLSGVAEYETTLSYILSRGAGPIATMRDEFMRQLSVEDD